MDGATLDTGAIKTGPTSKYFDSELKELIQNKLKTITKATYFNLCLSP